jgi:hypothetical protein
VLFAGERAALIPDTAIHGTGLHVRKGLFERGGDGHPQQGLVVPPRAVALPHRSVEAKGWNVDEASVRSMLLEL